MHNNYSDHLTTASELQLAEVDLFLSLAVIAGVVTFYMVYLMLRPLLEDGEISADEWTRLEDDSLALLRQRDRVIDELKEIEFEAAMNKLDAHDLSQLRGQYQREALRLIEELESQNAEYSERLSAHTRSPRKKRDPGEDSVERAHPTEEEPESSDQAHLDHEQAAQQATQVQSATDQRSEAPEDSNDPSSVESHHDT
jgi:hypothetical protein